MTTRRTSADWDAEAEVLRKRLDNARREARKMRKLEEYKAAEIQRQKDIQYALEFVQFSKTIKLNDSGMTAFSLIAGKLEEAGASEKIFRAGSEKPSVISDPANPNRLL